MKTKYRNRKQPTKKKARKNKTLKHKKSGKTRRLKRRSSKRRGGARVNITAALMEGLNRIDGEPRWRPFFINTAYDAFITNPKMFANVYGEGNHDGVTTYILDKFRQFSRSDPDLIEIIRIRNHNFLRDDVAKFIRIKRTHPFMGQAHENFVGRLFEIASPYDLPYDADVDSDTDS
jgi:hypothetical protein